MRVVSYALWGNNSLYFNGLEAIVKGHHACYPGWELRIHHDDTLYSNPKHRLAQLLHSKGLIRLIHAGENCGPAKARGMLWRMKPIWEEGVELCVCRDIDSVPVIQDRWAVEDFTYSYAVAHGINDAPAHSLILMGGMVAFKSEPFRKLIGDPDWNSFVSHLERPNDHGGDQEMLMSYVWPKVKGKTLVHRFNSNLDYEGCEMRRGTPKMDLPGISWAVRDEPYTNIMNHLGAAGYDVERAVKFYDKNGNYDCNGKYFHILKELE